MSVDPELAPGDVINRWTITAVHGAFVNAICACGTKRRNIQASKIRNGHTKSCGCYRHDHLRGKSWPDLTENHDTATIDDITPGDRYGRWTVLSKPYSQPGKRNRVVDARCDCDTQRPVVAGHLLSGRTKSCGCWRREGARAIHQGTNR